ncbi:alcohol dehydrogenase [acceptor]-like [Zophobas morio]|uniref:alcohol dehydrogenase [acceptor]-like n=1 Tax=Zophobas morio TaxID=2755281 RepID=UPI003082FABE
MPLLFEAFIYLLIGAVSASLTTDYYQKLISQETAKSLTYELPKKNEEFRSGFESNEINDYGIYDVVIVGAGTAGCILATRLSEIRKISILLIEAGGEENDFNQIPGMWPYNQFSEFNWGYYTIPQKHSCLGMKNRQCIVPRGKLLGGSSSINAMMYCRGNCKDYDKWYQLGNRGWSCKDVLPYFKKSENSQIHGDKNYHGKGGFWNVEYPRPDSPLYQNFVNGSVELKQPIVDYNGKNELGASHLQSNIKHGKRQSLATAFLDNSRQRRNLKILTKTLVTKVVIDPKSKKATGVEFVTSNKKFHVRTTKEVIVSAGAINTPQLLMLSGVGPKDELSKLKIPLIADLPVGKNLIEHPLLVLMVRSDYAAPKVGINKLIQQYLNGFGTLTKGPNVEGVGYIQTKNDSSEVPTIEILFSVPPHIDTSIFKREFNHNEDINNKLIDKIDPQKDIFFYIVLLHEKSRGRIFLNSSSPIDFPHIDLNMLEGREDVETLIAGMEYIQKLLKTEAFKKINATLLEVPICTNFKINSKEYSECLLRNLVATIYHPCGTAAMGPNNGHFVVGDTLQVHGTGNLRVVDASIFPSSISGHTSAPTVMVAEKAADLIKKEHKHL